MRRPFDDLMLACDMRCGETYLRKIGHHGLSEFFRANRAQVELTVEDMGVLLVFHGYQLP